MGRSYDDNTPVESIHRLEDTCKGQIALIIGNGESRLEFDLEDTPECVATFGCNAIYRDFHTDYLGAVDINMLNEILKVSGYDGNVVFPETRLMNAKPLFREDMTPISFDVIRGWSTGPTMAHAAAFLGFDPIYLMGFDMDFSPRDKLVNNVYRDTQNYRRSNSPITNSSNWVKQFRILFDKFTDRTFYQLGKHTFRDTDAIPVTWDEFVTECVRHACSNTGGVAE